MTPAIIGAIGATCFALSGAPEARRSWRRGRSDVAGGTVALWLGGEAAMMIYAVATYPGDLILLLNYTGNLALVSVIARYRWMPKVSA